MRKRRNVRSTRVDRLARVAGPNGGHNQFPTAEQIYRVARAVEREQVLGTFRCDRCGELVSKSERAVPTMFCVECAASVREAEAK